MKHLEVILFASLLLAGAVPGTCAVPARTPGPGQGTVGKDAAGKEVIIPPETGAVLLPELSTETFRPLTDFSVVVQLLGEGDRSITREEAHWDNGVWRAAQRKVVTMLSFPLNGILMYDNHMRGRYKLSYRLDSGTAAKLLEIVEYLPLNNDIDFWIPASFSLDLVHVDTEKLDWAADPGADGLRAIKGVIRHPVKGKVVDDHFNLSPKIRALSFSSDKKSAISLSLFFECVSGGKLTLVKWEHNNENLRDRRGVLHDAVLTGPVCAK